jgi:hypothetical protein
VAGVTVATRTAFERRAVTAPAVVESTDRGAFVESETGQRTFPVFARVRYDVDGIPVRSTITLGQCGAGRCQLLEQRGRTVTVATPSTAPARPGWPDAPSAGRRSCTRWRSCSGGWA